MEKHIWNPQAEYMDRKELEALQLERLKALVDYCDKNVKFYHDRFEKHGITADKIKCLSDIQYIPYTTKEDLRDNYPFGLFSVPQKEIVRLHASSGTTGNPTVVGYTRGDLENWSEQVARLVYAAGADENSIVQICFGYGMFTGALGLHYGLERIGATVVPTSSGNTEKQLKFMRDFGTDTIVATPSYCLYLAESAKERGIEFPLDQYKLKLGLLGSEGCTPEMRKQIEESWGNGFFCTDNYGMSELMGPGVSGECEYASGMHINEDHFYAEIIDPDTGEVLPEGSRGELVFTSLDKEAFPLLRYRTRDICVLSRKKCSCGRTLIKMAKPMGRTDDMLIIRGVNVFPSQIETVLLNEGYQPNYQIIVDRVKNNDTFDINVEIPPEMFTDKVGEIMAMEKSLGGAIKTMLGINPSVHLVPPKTIQRSEGKAKRVYDERNLHD